MLHATLKLVFSAACTGCVMRPSAASIGRASAANARLLIIRDIGSSSLVRTGSPTSRAFVPPCIPGDVERHRKDCLSRTSTDRPAGTLDAHLPRPGCKPHARGDWHRRGILAVATAVPALLRSAVAITTPRAGAQSPRRRGGGAAAAPKWMARGWYGPCTHIARTTAEEPDG